MLNRTTPPENLPVNEIDFVSPKEYPINDNVSLFHMSKVPNLTSRFDLVFDAGKCSAKSGVPSLVNGLLLSGTNEKNSIQIQEELNDEGGFYNASVTMEASVVSVHCLKENLFDIFKIVLDAIKNLNFPDHEVKEYLQDRKQSFGINMEKVGYRAQREFQHRLFLSNDYYADLVEETVFDITDFDVFKEFHSDHYLKGLKKIIIVGDIEETVILEMINLAESIAMKSNPSFENELTNEVGQYNLSKKNAVQSAIRIGRIMFNKKHEDYLDFLVLNTLLGNYFGSRLMSNIREDKGFTYGIGSKLVELHETGYFIILTEVGKDVENAAIQEIKFELKRLQNELVSENELDLVKNYMLGQLLKSADGPYAMTDLFIGAEIHGKGLEHYNQAISSIKNITPDRVNKLALKYLNWDDMTIVIAGANSDE